MFKNNKHYKLIVIEGIDGVGKTSTAQVLCKSLSACYYPLPPTLLQFPSFPNQLPSHSKYANQTLRQVIDSFAYSLPQARFLFYLLGLVVASQELNNLLEQSHVVCDRYLSSTLVYHWILDPNLRLIDISWLPILEPDYEFLLVIENTIEHRSRLNSRRGLRSDLLLEKNWDFLVAVQESFRILGLPEIDTGQFSLIEVVDTIIKRIKEG